MTEPQNKQYVVNEKYTFYVWNTDDSAFYYNDTKIIGVTKDGR